MILLSPWVLNEEDDDTRTLIAPNGIVLFNVSLDTLEMLGRMFLDEVEAAREEGMGYVQEIE